MAVITISNFGGNFNTAFAWVGGVVPGVADSILATATSGQLTVTVSASIFSWDLSLYTNTLTINSSITLTSTGAASTSTFGSSMSYSFLGTSGTVTQGAVTKGSNAQTWRMNGTTPIPRISCSSSSGIWTFGTNIYCTNFVVISLSQTNGNNVYISGTLLNQGAAALNGTSIFHMIGTGTLELARWTSAELRINTSGTITLFNLVMGDGTATSSTFRYLAGTIIAGTPGFGPPFTPIRSLTINIGPSANYTIELAGSSIFDIYIINTQITPGTQTLTFVGNTTLNNFNIDNRSFGAPIIALTGGNLTMANFGGSFGEYLSISNSILAQPQNVTLTLNPSYTYTINNRFAFTNSNKVNNTILMNSSTPGTKVPIAMNTVTQYVGLVNFTDINAGAGTYNIYGQNLTLSNTNNITQFTLPPSGGGGGESSYVFIS